jgi:hypothetical protein
MTELVNSTTSSILGVHVPGTARLHVQKPKLAWIAPGILPNVTYKWYYNPERNKRQSGRGRLGEFQASTRLSPNGGLSPFALSLSKGERVDQALQLNYRRWRPG